MFNTVEAKQILKDVFTTVIESGGSNYWAEFRNYSPSKCTAEVLDCENVDTFEKKQWKKIDVDTIARGIDRVASGKIQVAKEYVANCCIMKVLPEKADFDSIDADIILQAGLFNEVIYG